MNNEPYSMLKAAFSPPGTINEQMLKINVFGHAVKLNYTPIKSIDEYTNAAYSTIF